MCTCIKTDGFQNKLKLAKLRTNATGVTHVVFVLKALKQVFVCKEEDLTDDLGICCYYLYDGTEIPYVKKEVAEAVIEPNEIDVIDETIVDSPIGKLKRTKKEE